MTQHKRSDHFNTRWYVGCTDEDQKKARKELVNNSKRLRQVLVEIIDKDYEDFMKPSSETEMKEPSFLAMKCWREGYARALYDLKGIIK